MVVGLLVLVWVASVALTVRGPAFSSTPANSRSVTGTFVSWDPVDDAHGYAHFTVTNSGGTAEIAKCKIDVRDDFGDFGFDSMTGERIEAGQTKTFRMPLSVGKGSFLMKKGTVRDC
jgi:hypothetical protein